ncbi:MAG: HEAT repeat domain-containing protein [Candidatus Omnitrophota bacterium]
MQPGFRILICCLFAGSLPVSSAIAWGDSWSSSSSFSVIQASSDNQASGSGWSTPTNSGVASVSYPALSSEQSFSAASLLIDNGYAQEPDSFITGLSSVFFDSSLNVASYFGGQAGNYDLAYDSILLFDPGALEQNDIDILRTQGVDITALDTVRVDYDGKDILIMNGDKFSGMRIFNSDGTPGDDYPTAVEETALREVNTDVRKQFKAETAQEADRKAQNEETGYAVWSALGEKYENYGQAVAPLIDKLNSADPAEMNSAIKALGKIGEPAVVPLINKFLGTGYEGVKGAMDALLEIGVPAVDPLIDTLPTQESGNLANVIYLLGQIGEKRAAGSLIPFLKSDDVTTQKITVYSLGLIKDSSAVSPLIDLLRDTGSSDYRDLIIESLGEIGDPLAVDSLIHLLKDSDPSIRVDAAGALGSIKDSRATGALAVALKDENTDVVTAAAEALGKIGTDEAVTLLLNTLTGGTDSESRAASSGLAVAGASAVEPLIGILENGESGYKVKLYAAEALGKLKDARAIEPLTRLMETGSNANVETAANALVSIGKDSTLSLIGLLNNDDYQVKEAAVESLGKIGDPRAIESLIACFSEGNSTLAWAAKDALAGIGQSAVGPLTALLQDDDTTVQQFAIRALGEIKGPGIAEQLIPFLEDSNVLTRGVTIVALDNIGGLEGIEALAESLGNEENSANRLITEMALLNHLGVDKAMQIIKDKKAGGSREETGYYDKAIADLQRRSDIVNDLYTQYGISVLDGLEGNGYFDLYQLEWLNTVFTSIPEKLLEGLDYVCLLPHNGKYAGGAAGARMSLHDYSMDMNTVFHETGHIIDDELYNWNAFGVLYAESASDEDFACDYGKVNKLEDFATSFEYYTKNSEAEFTRAIDQAEAGKTVYLEKMLFVSDVFAKANDDKTLFYRIDEEQAVHCSEAAVTRDSLGAIAAIGGTSIYNADGSYNLNGLKTLFAK